MSSLHSVKFEIDRLYVDDSDTPMFHLKKLVVITGVGKWWKIERAMTFLQS